MNKKSHWLTNLIHGQVAGSKRLTLVRVKEVSDERVMNLPCRSNEQGRRSGGYDEELAEGARFWTKVIYSIYVSFLVKILFMFHLLFLDTF